MSLDLERALSRAADGPTPDLDMDRLRARGLRRRRTLQVGGAAGAALVLAVAGVAVVTTTAPPRPIVGAIEESPVAAEAVATAETPDGLAAVRLAVIPTTVPEGHLPDTVLVNDGAVALSATPQCSLDRWDGAWVDLGQQHFDPPYEIPPGQAGPWQSCLTGTSLAQLEPGRYRVRWQLTAGGSGLTEPQLTVAARFEVVDADLADVVAPLPPEARAAEPDTLPAAFVAAMDLREGDLPLLIPVSGTNRSVAVRTRSGAPPLMVAASCDALAALVLPQGWSALCLERNVSGERTAGRFPYGTTSVGSPGPPTLCGEVGWDEGRLPADRDPCVHWPRKGVDPAVGWR